MKMCTVNNAQDLFYLVYKKSHTKISDYAHHFLKDREEARDIVAELFIKLWDRRESFPTACAMRLFMYKSTRNACLNRLRTIKNQRRRQCDIIKHYYSPVTYERAERAESREAALIRVIQSLDTRYQHCILLFYFEKWTYKMMSAKLDISERKVKHFLVSGKVKIKSALSSN